MYVSLLSLPELDVFAKIYITPIAPIAKPIPNGVINKFAKK